MEEYENDNVLLNILTKQNNIVSFLDTIFGFLSRCTDFYYLKDNCEDNIGFDPGVAEEVVLNSFRKFNYQRLSDLTFNESETIIEEHIEHEEIVCTEEEIQEIHEEESEEFFNPCEYYNGAQHDDYCWSQSISDLDIYLKLPENISKSKEISLVIGSNTILMKSVNSDEVLLDKILNDKCRNNDAIWSIISEHKLHITLEKLKIGWWNKLFVDEESINVKTIDCSRNIDELSESSQAMLEKLCIDREQSRLKKLNTEEKKNLDILKNAWHLEDSPFKNEPFNPSEIKFE